MTALVPPVELPGVGPLPMRQVVRTWWPLAASWLLMAAEGPVISAVVARLAQPEVNLAAFGGVVMPLALIIESPIIMLLSASTALSKDWESYLRLRRFMMGAGALLTALHLLIAFTPLYYTITVGVIRVPDAIVEPGRWGLMVMLPWTWAIAYRRFNQGVLIRFGRSEAVGAGTMVRLLADVLVLAVGYLLNTVPGIVVASGALTAGVISEAVFAGLWVRPVLRDRLRRMPPVAPALTFRSFAQFYTPLALTSLLNLLAQPIGGATLSRMPLALESLAAWPVVSGLLFLLRSLGVAANEVVIALLDQPGSARSLARFKTVLAVMTTVLLVIVAAPPVARFWFGRLSALSPELTALAGASLWLALPLPALAALQSWFQGAMVHSQRTRGVTEAVAVFLLTTSAILWAGVVWSRVAGLTVGVAALTVGSLAQTAWLWHRSRPALRHLRERDARTESPPPAQ